MGNENATMATLTELEQRAMGTLHDLLIGGEFAAMIDKVLEAGIPCDAAREWNEALAVLRDLRHANGQVLDTSPHET
jgi:hypothetical protein